MDTAVQDAWNKKIPIEGKITGERKGGYSVQLAAQGRTRAEIAVLLGIGLRRVDRLRRERHIVLKRDAYDAFNRDTCLHCKRKVCRGWCEDVK